jgi:hypothetical protein
MEDRLRVMRKCVGSFDDAAEEEEEEAWEDAEGGAAFRSRAWSAVKYRMDGFQAVVAERTLAIRRSARLDREIVILRAQIMWWAKQVIETPLDLWYPGRQLS